MTARAKPKPRGKSKDRQWLEEYAPDMGLKLVKKGSTWQLKEIKTGKVVKEATHLFILRDEVLRRLQKYIGDHTVIVRK